MLALLLACGFLLAACDGESPSTDGAETGAETGRGTSQSPGELARCDNAEGFSIGYPAGWEVNRGNGVRGCSQFHPEPFRVPEATDERVAAVTAYVDPVPFERATAPEPGRDTDRTTTTIDGLRAVRMTFEAGEDSLYPAGTPIATYAIDVTARHGGEPATLFVDTVGTPGFDYERNVEVLDRMARSVEVAGPDRSGDRGEGVEPVGEPSTEPVEAGGFPSADGTTALLTDVRVGAHDGFDRIVLELEDGTAPSYRVSYVEPPVRQDGSGRTVAVDGSAFLELRLTPASGVERRGEEVEPTYAGPSRIAPRRASFVAELVRVGDFEAQLAWVAGVDRRRPFAVALLQEPTRLVVDILRQP